MGCVPGGVGLARGTGQHLLVEMGAVMGTEVRWPMGSENLSEERKVPQVGDLRGSLTGHQPGGLLRSKATARGVLWPSPLPGHPFSR